MGVASVAQSLAFTVPWTYHSFQILLHDEFVRGRFDNLPRHEISEIARILQPSAMILVIFYFLPSPTAMAVRGCRADRNGIPFFSILRLSFIMNHGIRAKNPIRKLRLPVQKSAAIFRRHIVS
jgi:hypothetical protein